MASFIGSNEQKLSYNFKHKIAGSTVENPLKIYSSSVNPSNLPAPTSTEWKEIKNQNFIDRLSQQDGNTVVETTSNSVLGNIVSTNAPCDGMMNIEIGGNTRYKRADGTYTDTFEEGCTLASVGELEGNKIEVLTCGKNLFDKDKALANNKGYVNIQGGISTDSKYYSLFVKIKPNTSYTLVNNLNTNTFWFSDLNTRYISTYSSTNGLAPQNANYLGITVEVAKIDIVQLEEGTVATDYTPYQTDKINILTSEPLRGLPNGVRDIASGDSVERKTGKVVLNENESYGIGSIKQDTTINTIKFEVSGINDVKNQLGNERNGVFSNNLKNTSWYGLYDYDEEGIAISSASSKFGIRILKSKLTQYGFVEGNTETYIPAFKAWLQANPVTVYYELAEPTIEKLPQPLTLQSFKNGSLQVNTAIPPYIKEWHTTNTDDKGVMQYQSGTTGLSQAFLTQIPLSSITNDIFGGSLPALKSAYKLFSNCDISAYGSGDNNGVETNNISYKVWNGTEYVLLNTNTSNVVSNINNILNNSNYVVDNNIYILMHTLPASDTIKSQINLDYFNAFINIARQPDNVIIPDTVKNTYIPTNYSIFVKVACLKTNDKKVITQYYKDASNYIELNIENNKVNFLKCINGVVTTLSSNVLDYNKFQVLGIVAQQQNTGMKLSVLKNNSECEHFSNTDVNILSVATEWKLGHDINITNQLDGFVVDYQFIDKTFTNTECEVMLKGRNTTGDITYDSFVRDYQNGKIQSGFILPNNKYKIIGQVKLYYNDSYSRMVENCEFVIRDDENKVELVGMAEMVRVD